MGLLNRLPGRGERHKEAPRGTPGVILRVERLEDRCVPTATTALNPDGSLVVTGSPVPFERIALTLDSATNQIVVNDNGLTVGAFNSASVASITVNGAARDSIFRIAPQIQQPATINGGPGINFEYAGGGPTTLVGGPGINRLTGGSGADQLDATQSMAAVLVSGSGSTTVLTGPGIDFVLGAKDKDVLLPGDGGKTVDLRISTTPPDLSQFLGLAPSKVETLSTSEVSQLLQRAAAATASDNAIVAVVDRGGHILGVRVEGNVSPAITQNTQNLVFAVDGAVAEARTGAFFGNNQAPLTSRTIQFISQTSCDEIRS